MATKNHGFYSTYYSQQNVKTICGISFLLSTSIVMLFLEGENNKKRHSFKNAFYPNYVSHYEELLVCNYYNVPKKQFLLPTIFNYF